MRLRWFHTRWTSRLWSNRVLAVVTMLMDRRWNVYVDDHFGTFPTRAAAMRAVTSATDPKKGYFL